MASEREIAWLDIYLETGDARKATDIVFPNNSNPVVRTSQLKTTLADDIEKRLRAQFIKDSPTMFNIVRDLALHSKQDSTKLKAAQDILSRSGLNPIAESRDLTEKPSEDKLKERLKLALTGIDPATLKDILGGDTLQTLARQLQDEPADEAVH